ncbi:SAF domain-containing protein [Microbacterium thalassium]|uniref:SAF domain-containing protein n=1 Tax=Microbacterium thalassium TaxID=362649 RepID=A0A7X0KUN4_9MICO|nr:SAF domain-containing protein [Microbacterium thalassium]MBB6391352.1 hypothetical protein [Microbacterium thalassium]GLK23351.1 hypothetical protein GCM10017607_06690 [Microbacterium thalassium]
MTAAPPERTPLRPARADLRLVLGLVLIAASVAGVWLVVTASRQTEPVFATVRTLVPGDPITAADVRAVEVGLGQVAGAYLGADDLTEGLIATRTVGEGELLARDAVGPDSAIRTTHVVVRSSVDVPASVGTGSTVEVWSAPLLEPGRYDVPRILLADAIVVSVEHDDSAIGAAGATLEIIITRSDVAATLAAMADGAAISVVPVAGSSR